MPVATNSDIELIHYANIALKAIYRDGYWYKKSGVIVTEIVPENQIQLDLLDTMDRDKHAKLMGVIDDMTDRFGCVCTLLCKIHSTSHRQSECRSTWWCSMVI